MTTRRFADNAAQLLGADAVRGIAVADDVRARMPAALVAFWEQVGGTTSLMQCFQNIALPNAVEMHGAHALFMEENQGVCFWGCPCDVDDPPVFQYLVTAQGLSEAYAEDACLSDFLTAMIVMQAVQSELLAHTGYTVMPLGKSAPLLSSMTALPGVGGFQAFLGSGVAVGIIDDGEEETVLVATDDADTFAQLADALGIDVDDFAV
jgi:hypothetical protein